eukprot:gene6587-10750_t
MWDDDEFVPFRGFSQQKKSEEKDYTKGISFMASSINEEKNQTSDEDEKKTEDAMEEEEENFNETEEYIIEEEDLALKHAKKKPLSNADFSSLFGSKKKEETKPQEEKTSNFSVIEPKNQRKESERKKRKLEEKKEEESIKNQPKRDKEYAGFLDEKVGKNVLNMMLNMGFNYDKGLGKAEDGIVNPIQMVVTDKGRGEIISDDSKLEKEKLEAERKAKLELPSREDNWKKNRKKTKVKYITADELVDQKTILQPIVSEIIDMTGPQTKVLTSSKDISFNQKNSLSRILPELQYNINQLVNLSENSIQETDKNIKLAKERMIFLESEKLKLANRIEKQRKDKKELSNILKVINDYYIKMKEEDKDEIDLEELKENFEFFQMNYPQTYEKFKISKCLLSIIQPNLKKEYETWKPFEEPKRIEKIKFFKKLFSSETDYEILLNEVILPILRRSLFESNLKEETTKILKYFKVWKNLLTENLLNSIFDKIVIPKIKTLIEEWNPKKDIIHSLILDWMPLLGLKFQVFGHFELIKNKIIRFLNEEAWSPGDDLSIYKYMKIWKEIFPSQSYQQNIDGIPAISGDDYFLKILNISILPKLINFLSKEFEINPANQKIEPFLNVLKWNTLIPNSLFISIFEQEFFTKWTLVLYKWLNNEPNFNEILNWYNGWKQIFPESFLENERIQSLFNKGLDMINQALSNQEIILEEKKEKYEKKFEKLKPKTQDLSFRELLEQFAAEENILFEPKGTQKYLGKQLYLFGGVPLYIDNEIIYAKKNQNNYEPVSLNELIVLIK